MKGITIEASHLFIAVRNSRPPSELQAPASTANRIPLFVTLSGKLLVASTLQTTQSAPAVAKK